LATLLLVLKDAVCLHSSIATQPNRCDATSTFSKNLLTYILLINEEGEEFGCMSMQRPNKAVTKLASLSPGCIDPAQLAIIFEIFAALNWNISITKLQAWFKGRHESCTSGKP
jgi:hypothetical protein